MRRPAPICLLVGPNAPARLRRDDAKTHVCLSRLAHDGHRSKDMMRLTCEYPCVHLCCASASIDSY